MSNWTRYDHNKLAYLPNSPGVYVIYYKGKLSYIGESIKVRSRILEHLDTTLPKHCVDLSNCYFKVLSCKKMGEWAMREIRLLVRLSPPWNYKFGLGSDIVALKKYLAGNGIPSYLDPYGRAVDMARQLKREGLTNSHIANSLNARGYKSRTGKRWSPIAIKAIAA